MQDRIRLSTKAQEHLVRLLEAKKKADEDLSQFVSNCAMALNLENEKYFFNSNSGCFYRLPASGTTATDQDPVEYLNDADVEDVRTLELVAE